MKIYFCKQRSYLASVFIDRRAPLSLNVYVTKLFCTDQPNIMHEIYLFTYFAVSVDLRVSRIYRHLAAFPSFGGQIAGAGGTPRLS